MAADQRYCLDCGLRRGDPRLPFMDAVVFMDAVRQPRQAAIQEAPPPPPKETRSSISANASLIAGVGTLLLALGIGVLIGKTGEGSSGGGGAPSVIRVGDGAETASTGSSASEAGGDKAKKGAASPTEGKAAKAQAKKKLAADSSGTTKATAEVLKPVNGVKFAPPTVQKGGSCEEGTAGCENGKFEGNFFE
jgi:hypothetical protein